MGLGLCPQAAEESVLPHDVAETRSAPCTAPEKGRKRSAGSSPGLCRYKWKPQLLVGLVKGQPPGKQLCENDLGVLVDC